MPPLCQPATCTGAAGGGGTTAQCSLPGHSCLQVYDELLAAALQSQGCGPRNLELFGPWKWLLGEFAAAYGVRHHYTSLSYLKWVVRPENATVTADCFEVLLRELVPLKQVGATWRAGVGGAGHSNIPCIQRLWWKRTAACQCSMAGCQEPAHAACRAPNRLGNG